MYEIPPIFGASNEFFLLISYIYEIKILAFSVSKNVIILTSPKASESDLQKNVKRRRANLSFIKQHKKKKPPPIDLLKKNEVKDNYDSELFMYITETNAC